MDMRGGMLIGLNCQKPLAIKKEFSVNRTMDK